MLYKIKLLLLLSLGLACFSSVHHHTPQVKRPGDVAVRCTILLLLDYQPLQFKLDQRLARLLGVHTQTRYVNHLLRKGKFLN